MDRRIIDLYDAFTHGRLDRRTFLRRLGLLAGSSAAASALLPLLMNDYAKAQTVAEDDSRIVTETVSFGTDEAGYLAAPAGDGRHGAVIVIHENRGLNPHIRDVARRYAAEGFLALAPDYLAPIGGTPDDEDRAREMIGTLEADRVLATSIAALEHLAAHERSNGRVGAVGFCWGGGQVGALAVAEPRLAAGIVYYGRQPPADRVAAIEAPLLLHYAGLDERINAGIPEFEAALQAADREYILHMYEDTNHAFANDTNAARHDPQAAALAFSRSIAFLREHLSEPG